MRGKIVVSRGIDDMLIDPWVRTLGFDIAPSKTKLDSWVSGVIVGGGSDPRDPEDKQRNDFEFSLVSDAVKLGIPCLGICRGCEVLATWGNAKLSPIPPYQESYHKHSWHDVRIDYPSLVTITRVWSNHHLGITHTGGFTPSAWAADGSIEGLIDVKNKVLGVMWHPEKSGQSGFMTVKPWIDWANSRR